MISCAAAWTIKSRADARVALVIAEALSETQPPIDQAIADRPKQHQQYLAAKRKGACLFCRPDYEGHQRDG